MSLEHRLTGTTARYLETHTETSPPRWPPWYAPAAFLTVMAIASVLMTVLAGATGTFGEDSPPGLVLTGTLLLDLAWVATAVGFASLRLAPRGWHFGLRRTSFWPAAGLTALAIVCFFAVTAGYTALVGPGGEQTVAEDLGADRGTALLIAASVLVVGVAPFAEEFFFRGFFYGALRTRFGVLAAATLDGLLFGAIHYTGPETLSILPPLAFLGFLFCLLYERTGSLYAPIAFHTINNAIALSAAVGSEAVPIALAVAVLTLLVCLLAARRQRRGAPLPFGPRQWLAASAS